VKFHFFCYSHARGSFSSRSRIRTEKVANCITQSATQDYDSY